MATCNSGNSDICRLLNLTHEYHTVLSFFSFRFIRDETSRWKAFNVMVRVC